MSGSLHPHWQATDDGAPVPVRVAAHASVPKDGHRVSRRPAAVVGMVLAATIGTIVYTSTSSVEGDLTRSSPPPDVPQMTYMDLLKKQLDGGDVADIMNGREEGQTSPGSPTQVPMNRNTATAEPTIMGGIPTNDQGVSADVTERMHSGAPHPVRTPQTGAETTFVTIAAAAGMLWILTRRHMEAKCIG